MSVESINSFFGDVFENPNNWTKSAIVILSIIILRFLLLRIIDKLVRNHQKAYHYKRNFNYFSVFVMVAVLLLIWVEDKETFFKYFGVFSAGLAIAMHETIANLAGWFFIISRQPFTLGERICVDGNSGDVVDINSLYFTVLEVGGERVNSEQSTGRLIHIPNSKVLKTALINYSQGFNFIWNEMSVHITYESDWKLAKQIITEIVNEVAGHYPDLAEKAMHSASRQYFLKFGKLTPIVYTDTIDYGVRFSVRFIVSPREIRNTECVIWEKILERFAKEENINLAYKTMRFYTANEDKKNVEN